MKRIEIADIINDIERDFPVNEWVIGGMHIWPVLRINIAFALFYLSKDKLEDITKENIRRKNTLQKVCYVTRAVSSYLKAYFLDFRHNVRPNNNDAVFLNHTTCRLFSVEGGVYDVFCDPLIDILDNMNIKSLVLEFAPAEEYRIPRYRPSMFIDLNLITIKIMNQLFTRQYDDISNITNAYVQLKTCLEKRIEGYKLIEISQISSQIQYIRAVADFYKKIFSIIKPKIGFVVTYYSALGMAFNLACREFGIPSMDIQHGVQGYLHPAYGRWRNLPTNGYELLPTKFLCWSQCEADAIEDWNRGVSRWHAPIILGNLYMNMFKDVSNPIPAYFKLQVNNIMKIKGKSVNILLTLQPSFAYGLLDIFKEAISLSPPSWYWWVRLHPGMRKEQDEIIYKLSELHVSNFNVEEASELPLYGLLPEMDVHVAATSTTVIEAAQFGVPSVLTGTDASDYYPDLISSGFAVTAFTPEHLIKAIAEQVTKKKNHYFETTSEQTGYAHSVLVIHDIVRQFAKEA